VTTGIGRHEERSTARIIGTVYPVTCAISSSVSPARCAITDRIREREPRRREGGTRAEQLLGCWSFIGSVYGACRVRTFRAHPT